MLGILGDVWGDVSAWMEGCKDVFNGLCVQHFVPPKQISATGDINITITILLFVL